MSFCLMGSSWPLTLNLHFYLFQPYKRRWDKLRHDVKEKDVTAVWTHLGIFPPPPLLFIRWYYLPLRSIRKGHVWGQRSFETLTNTFHTVKWVWCWSQFTSRNVSNSEDNGETWEDLVSNFEGASTYPSPPVPTLDLKQENGSLCQWGVRFKAAGSSWLPCNNYTHPWLQTCPLSCPLTPTPDIGWIRLSEVGLLVWAEHMLLGAWSKRYNYQRAKSGNMVSVIPSFISSINLIGQVLSLLLTCLVNTGNRAAYGWQRR